MNAEDQFETNALVEELVRQRELWANEAAQAKAQLTYAKKQLAALQQHSPDQEG